MSEEYTNLGFLGKPFQFKLLYNIVWDGDFGRKIVPKLQSSYFDELNYKHLFSLIKSYHDTNENTPNIDNLEQVIRMEIADPVQKNLLIANVNLLTGLRKKYETGEVQPDAQFIRTSVWKFVRQQEWKRVLAEAQAKLENGDLDTADELPDLLRSALMVGSTEDYGKDIYDYDDSFFIRNLVDGIKTGIKEIDDIIIGLPKGKLGMILAGQGIGKSRTLTFVANEAYKQGKNVLHITFDENSREEIMKLHYAKWSGIDVDSFETRREEVVAAIKASREEYRVGSLTVQRFSSDGTTIPKIRNWIKAYQDMYGMKFDMVVLDYIDEVETHKVGKDGKWAAEADVVKAFHSMLVDFDICGWTATQAKKESNDKRYLVFDDCGGSVAKLKKAQLVIAIGADLEQKENNRATFTLLKSNFSKCGHVFDDALFDRGTLRIELNPSVGMLPPNLIAKFENTPDADFIPVRRPNLGNNQPSAPAKSTFVQPNLSSLGSLVPQENSYFENEGKGEPIGGSVESIINDINFDE